MYCSAILSQSVLFSFNLKSHVCVTVTEKVFKKINLNMSTQTPVVINHSNHIQLNLVIVSIAPCNVICYNSYDTLRKQYVLRDGT